MIMPKSEDNSEKLNFFIKTRSAPLKAFIRENKQR